MQRTTFRIMLASCAIAALSATGAAADCAEELAALTGGQQDGISKDGSMAPLEENASGVDAAASGQPSQGEGAESESGSDGEVAKDGSTAPLETESGEGADVATSGQEAQGQQEQAQQAMGGSGESNNSEALARAQEALAQGDEQGCMDALEQARQM